ncbi:MAG: DUF2330 domain-containing protein [Polyangiaceae bacterium]|nr:DUF2330 domain-containing protein [Polyangiaceae bacterium]
MMRNGQLWVAAAATLTFAITQGHLADACGGCVVPPGENTVVTGHRMILSVSMQQTTLYDQIEYAGNPESFAWFLPIQGQVEIGLSSDAMFAYLGDESQVTVLPPWVPCNSGTDEALASSSDGKSGSVNIAPEEEVNVIAQEVVGPYETVQLEAGSPDALINWLTQHGYAVPADVEPVIAGYQQEGFGFLAMKLVPGEGVNSMRPVRVTSPGGGLTLPLRMVAAGTGAVTPVTLYVVSEGRYEVAGRPNLQVNPALLVWNWDEGISNYRILRDQMVDNTDGMGFLTESAGAFSKSSLVNRVTQTIEINPGTTGWGNPESGATELEDATADLETLFAGQNEKDIWLTRLYGRLSRKALETDLTLSASADQDEVDRYLQATIGVGTYPCRKGTMLACAVNSNTSSPQAIWALGAAIAALCARRGKSSRPR